MRIPTRSGILLVTAMATLFLSVTFPGCTTSKAGENVSMTEEYYAARWKEVQKALDKGLPKSALKIVEEVYAKAKKDRNQPQYIKAASYRVALIAQTTDEGEVFLVKDIEREIESAKQPVKAIFQSMLANLYWGYYQAYRWRIGQRTQVSDVAEDDFRTWDARKFFDTTRALYLTSLEEEELLQDIPVREFSEILVSRSNSDTYRPTLYDLLAHRALEFFKNDETSLPRAVHEFEVTALDAFTPAAEFAEFTFETPDETDQKYNALLLYQKLTRFHLDGKDTAPLIDLDLSRLEFARSITFHEDKDTTYFTSLQRMYSDNENSGISTQIGYEIAKYQHGKGDYVKAIDLCNREIARFAESRGAINCKALRSQILRKEIGSSTELTVLPDAPFMISTSFRNLDKVWFRVVELDDDEQEDDMFYGDRTIQKVLGELSRRKPVREWEQELPETDDYKVHRVDVKGPAIPYGRYMLLMSADRNFSLSGNAISYSWLYSTRLSLQSQNLENGTIQFWVRDAENGLSLSSVTVTLFSRSWNSGQHRYEKNRIRSLKTDKHGSFTLRPSGKRDNVYITLSHGKDRYSVRNAFYPYRRGKTDPHKRSLIFTDRSLYRPGQTVYFKGIVLRADPENVHYAVVPKTSTTVYFYDANGQKISEQKVTTNEYGSYSGSFTTPSGVLTGTMNIRDSWGNRHIRVEEYKRPKFEVTFQPIAGEFSLFDTVVVSGLAKAYAGSNIDNAEVSYRVVRRARFPYWYWWWRPFPASEEKEIAHGDAVTDGKGEFVITFPALPDKSISRKTLPVFTYTVYADVTDINGETRSGSTSISVGYTSLMLSASMSLLVEDDADTKIGISSANLNGQPLAATGSVIIEKLTVPRKILRNRLLPEPDKFTLSRDEFISAFPHEAYRDEADQDSWAVDRKYLDERFNTGEAGVDSVEISDFPAGRYRLTVEARDPGGEDIIVKKFFTVYESGASRPPLQTASILIPVKTSCAPGETASFIWATSYADVPVLYQVEHRGKIVHEEMLSFDNEQKTFEIPVLEKHRGGLSAHISFVQGYRQYSESIQINVPWSNKQLHVKTSTFRDKLRPGQDEEWRITIKGEKAETVAAEMVATMYDASLDAIWSSGWNRFSWPTFYGRAGLHQHSFSPSGGQLYQENWNRHASYFHQYYDNFNLFLLSMGSYYANGRGYRMMKSGAMREGGDMDLAMAPSPASEEGEAMADEVSGLGRRDKEEAKNGDDNRAEENGKAGEGGLGQVKARTNFNETAFFFPQLLTNEKGEIVLSFTVPEALTRWRLMTFAHTPDLKVGYMESSTVTQKELMVMPNAPRFLREDDELVFPIKITNMSKKPLSGSAKLSLFDAYTMQPVDGDFKLTGAEKRIEVEAERSTSVQWKISVPSGISAIVYRVVARAGDFSDGEEAPLPVLPNRMLVTESLPLNIRGNQTRTYTFDKLVNSSGSGTLRHHKLTLEMTSNPAWYAIQALPYIMEFPHECSEQVFNRYYANSIASHLVNSKPKIKRIFDQWKGTDALLSNLEKNEELKAVLLQETPWVRQGKNESERKKRVALLFDLNTMSNNLDNAVRKLQKKQAGNGGWPWFAGMPESRYITQYIVAGFGHLKVLGITSKDARIGRMITRALNYIDERMHNHYVELKRRHRTLEPERDWLGYLELQYLYARSYFLDQEIDNQHMEAVNFWLDQARRHWLKRNLMSQGMIALSMHRFEKPKTPAAIVNSLRERSLQSDELGMFWKYEHGWFWYQAPISTQALLIEAFDEIADDKHSVEEMKIWLLKQKQVQDWKTTVSTADACYALLRRGSDLLVSDKLVEVSLGGKKIDPRAEGGTVEAGTGYYKLSWNRGEIKPDMGKVTVTKRDDGIAWGAVYWQYFERLDKITPHKTPLHIEKKLYRQRNTDQGVKLEPITEKNRLEVGDVLKVRIEIRVDRSMEYIHMKDMRGSGLDIINQISRYRWQGGLGYYEAPKDASVNFFIHWLPKGVYVFEYALRVSHSGTFSNGITTIQSMYAPEFSSHTAGTVVTVK